MNIVKQQPIGTFFKKENVFLATVLVSQNETKEVLNSKANIPENLKNLVEFFIEEGIIDSNRFDLFYKEDTGGYICFEEDGSETFAGDDSDGKGKLVNVVSIWEYYSEEQIRECMLDNGEMLICVLDDAPIYQYNEEYNKV